MKKLIKFIKSMKGKNPKEIILIVGESIIENTKLLIIIFALISLLILGWAFSYNSSANGVFINDEGDIVSIREDGEINYPEYKDLNGKQIISSPVFYKEDESIKIEFLAPTYDIKSDTEIKEIKLTTESILIDGKQVSNFLIESDKEIIITDSPSTYHNQETEITLNEEGQILFFPLRNLEKNTYFLNEESFNYYVFNPSDLSVEKYEIPVSIDVEHTLDLGNDTTYYSKDLSIIKENKPKEENKE